MTKPTFSQDNLEPLQVMAAKQIWMERERPTVKLIGEDGNAFAIMARVTNAMRRAGATSTETDAYLHEAQSGDYDHLLQVTMEWVNVPMMDPLQAAEDRIAQLEEELTRLKGE